MDDADDCESFEMVAQPSLATRPFADALEELIHAARRGMSLEEQGYVTIAEPDAGDMEVREHADLDDLKAYLVEAVKGDCRMVVVRGQLCSFLPDPLRVLLPDGDEMLIADPDAATSKAPIAVWGRARPLAITETPSDESDDEEPLEEDDDDDIDEDD